jgi:sRNA-binding protein
MSKGSKRRYQIVRCRILAEFPGCFAPRGEACRPLAIGINTALAAAMPDLSTDEVQQALHQYTCAWRYKTAVAAGGPRYNLAGEIEGEVTPDDQAHAAAKLAAMKEAKKARGAAKKEARQVAHQALLAKHAADKAARLAAEAKAATPPKPVVKFTAGPRKLVIVEVKRRPIVRMVAR